MTDEKQKFMDEIIDELTPENFMQGASIFTVVYKCMACGGTYPWVKDGHTECKLCHQDRKGYTDD